MRTLLIDNYDSFTYNLFQLLAEENGAEPIVVRNDEAGWDELARLGFDNVVLSPGPGRPERPRDFGVCAEAIRRCAVPLLGVCLGHQGIGWVSGGRVGRAPRPRHGHVDAVEHAGDPLFAGIARRFAATRYHSLRLERPLPADLEEIAWAEDGTVMAIAHRHRPQWGVQFHPESVATEQGRRLIQNFRDLTTTHSGRAERGQAPRARSVPDVRDSRTNRTTTAAWELGVRRVDALPDAEMLFAALFGSSRNAFWLDSARPGPLARFSFMGDDSGPLGEVLTHEVGTGAESIFEQLERRVASLGELGAELPFDFACGFAGFLGYELKAECGGEAAHRSPYPDAAFVFAGRMVALDHERGHAYALCLHGNGSEETTEASAWLDATVARVRALAATAARDRRGDDAGASEPLPGGGAAPQLARPPLQYLEDIERCVELMEAGESYEICLTNSVAADVSRDPLDLYLRLRRVNPAPFAAYLRFGELAVLSSSPERFLAVDREGRVEARPIKGTAPRAEDPAQDARLAARLRTSEKNRAENLMIVDLLRNDLGAVCEPGSIEVAALMEVESYETVHQLVSTVRGRLAPGRSAAQCVRSCFPPGSMTGAPKLRTMEILDRLEGAPRGVYSGAIGYFAASGACDLSVTIRTIVLREGRATIGTGGAIVLESDPEGELGEALLKAEAPMLAIDLGRAAATSAGSGFAARSEV